MEAIDIDSIPTPKKLYAIFYWGRFGKFHQRNETEAIRIKKEISKLFEYF